MDVVRAAKTSQTPHDLELKYDELLAMKATSDQVAFISCQAQHLRHRRQRVLLDSRLRSPLAQATSDLRQCLKQNASAEKRGAERQKLLEAKVARLKEDETAGRLTMTPEPEWQTLDANVPKISDTYIAAAIRDFVEQKERYMLLWNEQHVRRGEFGFGDHSGKHGSRMKLKGDSILNWTLTSRVFYANTVEWHSDRWTEMNEYGQKVVSVRVQTTGWNDPSLVAAYDSRQRSDQRLGRPNPLRRLCLDNPKKDAAGAGANVYLGRGLDVLRFDGAVMIVRTEAECDAACAELENKSILGFDTENVAYVPPYMGSNIEKAAIVQLASETHAVIFVVHEWPHAYQSFKDLIKDDHIEKLAVNVSHDERMLAARFPEIEIRAAVELTSRVKANRVLASYSLASMVKTYVRLHLDKRMLHHEWQAPRLTARQVMYAVNDAYAALKVGLALLHETLTTTTTASTRDSIAALSTVSLSDAEVVDLTTNAAAVAAKGRCGEADEIGASQRVACTRYRRRQDTPGSGFNSDVDGDGDGDDADDDSIAVEYCLDVPNGLEGEDLDAGLADAETRAREDDLDVADIDAPVEVMDALKRRITAYHEDKRADDMELPSSLSSGQRKELHSFADRLGLFHSSIGVAGDRRLVITSFKPPESNLASVGTTVVGSLVARDIENLGCVRGRVESFDGERCRWELLYSDESIEIADIETLNRRIQRRYEFDMTSVDPRGGRVAAAADAALMPTAVGDDSRKKELATLLSGCDEDWATSTYSWFSYDPFYQCFLSSREKETDTRV